MSSLLGVPFPLVAVISESMEHEENFTAWWEEHNNFYNNYNITKKEFKNYSFRDGLNKGDVILLKNKEVKVGDVIAFNSVEKNYVIHRVVNIEPIGAKGDNNLGQINDIEGIIEKEQIVGVAWFKVPFLGYVKIGFEKIIDLLDDLVYRFV